MRALGGFAMQVPAHNSIAEVSLPATASDACDIFRLKRSKGQKQRVLQLFLQDNHVPRAPLLGARGLVLRFTIDIEQDHVRSRPTVLLSGHNRPTLREKKRASAGDGRHSSTALTAEDAASAEKIVPSAPAAMATRFLNRSVSALILRTRVKRTCADSAHILFVLSGCRQIGS